MSWTIVREVPEQEIKKPQWTIVREVPEAEVPQQPSPEQNPEFNWPRFLGEHMAKGAFGLADLASLLMSQNLNAQLASNYQENYEVPLPSELIKELKEHDVVNLESQGPGNTPFQRAVGKGVQYGTGSIIPGGGLTAPLIGAATGVASSGLQELGVDPIVADLTSGLGMVGISAIKNMLKNGLSTNEVKVLKTLKQQMAPREFEQTLANFQKAPQYKTINYEPTTAEVANSPTLSALHRVRQGIPESGLAQRAGEQNEAIQSVFEPMKMNPSSSSQISEALKQELKQRKQIRHDVTNPMYESVKKIEQPLEPAHLKTYLKQSVEKGDLEKDIHYVKNLIKPKGRITKADIAYAKDYEKLPESIQKTLEKPKSIKPQVNELAAAHKAINSKINKYTRSGENERKLIMKRAKTELEKDLESIPAHREVTAKYKELSEPVSAISEHPKLKQVLKTRANEIMPEIFDKNSADNMKALKNALGKNESEWNGIREATADYFHKYISNAQAEGRSHVMSYPKIENFLKEHGAALKEVFEPDQLKFVDELKHALHGQNIAKTLAEGPGSPTTARTAINDILKQGFGLRAAEAITKYAPVPKVLKTPFRFMLNRFAAFNETNALKVLDEVLLHPEKAQKLMSHEFPNQMAFNKYMKNMIVTTPSLREAKKQEKDHE